MTDGAYYLAWHFLRGLLYATSFNITPIYIHALYREAKNRSGAGVVKGKIVLFT